MNKRTGMPNIFLKRKKTLALHSITRKQVLIGILKNKMCHVLFSKETFPGKPATSQLKTKISSEHQISLNNLK